MAYGTAVGAAVNAAVKTPGWVTSCGKAAPIISAGLFLAPYPTIKNIIADRSVGSFPLLPYSSMCVNAFMWMTYGILKKDSNIFTPNSFGLICGLNYFYQFRKNCSPKASNLPGTVSQHVNWSTILISFTLLVASIMETNVASSIIGKMAVFICIVLFASPLAALKTVIKTKDASSIPLPFTLTCMLNCFLWSVYGVLEKNDFNIYFPNIMGLASSIAQFILIMIFRNAPKTVKKNELPL